MRAPFCTASGKAKNFDESRETRTDVRIIVRMDGWIDIATDDETRTLVIRIPMRHAIARLIYRLYTALHANE